MEDTKTTSGFHVVCGVSPKNGINGVVPGIRSYRIGDEKDRTLDLSEFNNLLVADLEYFVDNHERILDMVKEHIETRMPHRSHTPPANANGDEIRLARYVHSIALRIDDEYITNIRNGIYIKE